MADAALYRAKERLRDGREILIRAQRPDDRSGYLHAMKRVSNTTLYHRFFAAKRHFSEEEAHHFLDIDFVTQVALVAEIEEGGDHPMIGSARYIVTEPGRAEVSFSIIDEYQGKGLGGLLLDHLARIAREAGLVEFFAEVLAENRPMLRVFERSGLIAEEKRDGTIVEVKMRLTRQEQPVP